MVLRTGKAYLDSIDREICGLLNTHPLHIYALKADSPMIISCVQFFSKLHAKWCHDGTSLPEQFPQKKTVYYFFVYNSKWRQDNFSFLLSISCWCFFSTVQLSLKNIKKLLLNKCFAYKIIAPKTWIKIYNFIMHKIILVTKKYSFFKDSI